MRCSSSFARIKRSSLSVLPQRADVVLHLGRDHQVVAAANGGVPTGA